MVELVLTVNGTRHRAEVDPRTLLAPFLRDTLRLTGTHIGCDTTQCGACVVHLDGKPVKSCTMLAVSAAGSEVRTIEGLAVGAALHPVQAAFRNHHALQCGFCTSGMIMTGAALIEAHGPTLDEATIRHALEGNICRCTGYETIVAAIVEAAQSGAR